MQSEYKNYLKGRGIHPFVIQAYLDDLEDFARWFEETYQTKLIPGMVNPGVSDAFQRYLETCTALNRVTIYRKLQMLRIYSTWAFETGQVEAPIKTRVRWDAKRGSRVEYLDKLEQEALSLSLQNAYSKATSIWSKRGASLSSALVAVLLHGGLKAVEVCLLENEDILVSDQKIDVKVRGRRGERILTLDETAQPALQTWIELRPNWVETRRFFVNKRCTSFQPELVIKRVIVAGRHAGLVVTPSILRATFIKNKLDAGISPERVAAWLGQSELNMPVWYK